MADLISDRLLRRVLLGIALTGLILGTLCWLSGYGTWAGRLWAAGTIPVVVGLAVSMARDLLAGRLGVDAVAFVSMSAALLLGEPLAGAVVAVMYAGGNLLEDFAVARAERDLKSLVDRAPRVAHRRIDTLIEDVAIDQVAIGDTILVRAGSHHPLSRELLQAIAEAIRQGVYDALRAARPAFKVRSASLPDFSRSPKRWPASLDPMSPRPLNPR